LPMIPDWETNSVFFSRLLPERYPTLWERLAEILRQHRVPTRLIDGTRDLWARDYSPVQVGPQQFVKFRYRPDYLVGHKHLLTPGTICGQFQDLGNCRRTRIILDGGNVVAAKNRVILTEKVYRENPGQERSKLRSKLTELFQGANCLFIPKEAGDIIGHSDGVVRFLAEDLIVINNYSAVDPAYRERLCRILTNQGLQIEKLPHFREKQSTDGIPSAVGNYVNYLRVGNLIVVPAYKSRHDEKACETLQRLCPEATVRPLECRDLARAGGILNCIAFTVATP
jgi:agmatine deiminase